MKRILYILLLVMSLLAACSSTVAFRSEAGGFVVVAPVMLKEQPQAIDSSAGKIASHTFLGVKKDFTYVAAYTDYQEDALKNLPTETLLNNARDSMIASVVGFLLDEKSITINNYPGRDLSIAYTESGGTTRVISAHVFLVNTRLYQVMVFSSEAAYKAKDASITNFLDSFKLTNK